MARVAAVCVAGFLWFTFVAQIFVAEFFFYHPFSGWLNQALVLSAKLAYWAKWASSRRFDRW